MPRIERLLPKCFLASCLTLLPAAVSVAQELGQLCPCDQLPATVFVAGQVDGYAQPTDPTSRGTQLNAAFPNNIWKDFDDATTDAHVGHTFGNLPRDIVCAELEIHLKPASFGDNDTLYLGLLPPPAPQGQFAWAIRLKELPGTGGVWQPPLDPGPFTLDLGALQANSTSPLTSLIAKLNQDGRLDLLVQDDTVVDWVNLTVRTNPRATLACGLADLFASPTDPTFRGPELNALTVPFKDLDDNRSNRHVGHTFANLPANIVEASLEIRLRPHRDVPENDSLNLGLTPPSSFAFSQTLAALTGTGWHNGDAPATLTLDLAALPGGLSLLAKINVDHRLDVYVQDDSAVDYLRLRLRTCPPRRRFVGLDHLELGAATLDQNPAGHLVLSNLGPGLDDGVRIETGPARSARLDLEPIDFRDFAADAALELRGRGQRGTIANSLLYTTRLAPTADGFSILNDLAPLGLGSQKIEVVRDGQVVYTSGPLSDSPEDPQVAAIVAREIRIRIVLRGCDVEIIIDIHINFRVPAPGGGTTLVEGDTLRFLPASALAGSSLPELTATELIGLDLPPLEISGEALEQNGAFVSVLGSASFAAVPGSVSVSDLGSSGQAGFAIDQKGVKVIHASLAPIDPEDTAEAGAFVHAEAFGELNGLADQSLGTLAVTKTDTSATPFEVSADFSAIASPTQHVQLLKNGQVVVDLPGNSGPAAFASSWPSRIGKLGGETECYVQRFPPDTLFAIGGRTANAVAGDELRILAESQTATVGLKSELQLKAAGIPELTLTDVATGSDDGCTPGPDRLCLRGGRFALEATFATPNGDRGQAQAISLTDDTGYFWFFNPDNVEVVVKALNGCGVNNRFWVFSAGLTNVEVDLRVTDTVTGEVNHYVNPLTTAYPPKLDTSAFATCSEPAAGGLAEASGQEGFLPKADSLLLNNDRFRVEVSWRTNQGDQGAGTPVELTSDTGYFWFFNAANVEVVVKVLNGCGVNGKYWVFAAGLTNVEVVMTVTDTATGASKVYTNPLGQPFLPIQDTGAFSCSP